VQVGEDAEGCCQRASDNGRVKQITKKVKPHDSSPIHRIGILVPFIELEFYVHHQMMDESNRLQRK